MTTDLTRAFRVSSQLKAGSVYVNTFLTVDATAPFGGYKDSAYINQFSNILICGFNALNKAETIIFSDLVKEKKAFTGKYLIEKFK